MTDLIEEVEILVDMINKRTDSNDPIYQWCNVIGHITKIINGISLYSNWCGQGCNVSVKRVYPPVSDARIMIGKNCYVSAFIHKVLCGSLISTYEEIFEDTLYVDTEYDIEGVDRKMLERHILDEDLANDITGHDRARDIVSYLCDTIISRLESRYPLDGRGMKRISSFSDVSIITET